MSSVVQIGIIIVGSDDLKLVSFLWEKQRMHILVGLLGSIITVLVLFNRLAEAGISLGGLNPFLWKRRRDWRNKYEGNPIFQIDDPMDATAILMVATAKSDGDLTMEGKQQLLDLFESKFKLTKKDATSLLISSVHLIGKGDELRANVERFLAPSKLKYSPEQRNSAIELMTEVAGDAVNENAHKLVQKAASVLDGEADAGGW